MYWISAYQDPQSFCKSRFGPSALSFATGRTRWGGVRLIQQIEVGCIYFP